MFDFQLSSAIVDASIWELKQSFSKQLQDKGFGKKRVDKM
jgi:hypothetical protein